MNGDGSLSQSLSKLSEVAATGDAEEVARVRKARADVTEHARQSGDSAGLLIDGLIGDSNAEIEAERADKERKLREAEERSRASAEAADEKRRREAQEKFEAEKRRLEETEQRRQQMLLEIEKKRKRELGIIDEEEEAQKRAEEEAEKARIAAEKAREAAEAEALSASNSELADQIRMLKNQKAAQAAAEAKAKKRRQTFNIGMMVAICAIIVAIAIFFISSLKAADHYIITKSYPVKNIDMINLDAIPLTEKVYAFDSVVQTGPQTTVTKKHSSSGGSKKDEFGAADVFGSGALVK